MPTVTMHGPSLTTGELIEDEIEVGNVHAFEGAGWKVGVMPATIEFVFGEEPDGLINGANATFTAKHKFNPETVIIYVNGLMQRKPLDFNTSGTRTILMAAAPDADDVLLVSYLRT